jgi:hypothetical protein
MNTRVASCSLITRLLVLGSVAAGLSGCASLLPQSQQASRMPWQSFAEAKQAYDAIQPQQTTLAELHRSGFDPYQQPNITLLNYNDLMHRFMPNSAIRAEDLDPAIRTCLEVGERCTGYWLELKQQQRKRVGGFVPDFLNFKREVEITGWRFNALMVLYQDRVIYKQWTGQPLIFETERSRNPLGPLQGIGESSLWNK